MIESHPTSTPKHTGRIVPDLGQRTDLPPTPDATPRSSVSIWISLALLLASLVLGEATPVDQLLQDHFYDSASRTWVVDAAAPLPRLLLYDGPKAVIIAIGAALIVVLAGPHRWRTRLGLGRARLAATIVLLGLIPTVVGSLKDRSDVFCPAQLARYGGTEEFRRPFTPRPAAEQHARRGRCWPAGHASGGFALVSLALLARTPAGRRAAVALGLAAGWTMGLYQMLKGAHFLSHTLVTMFIACLLTAIVARCLPPPGPAAPVAPDAAR